MKKISYITLFIFLLAHTFFAQVANPYCFGNYTSGQCNQPGPSNSPGNGINDFINSVNTQGANQNICNNNSGCNGNASNYTYYSGTNLMDASPGQTITMNVQSGITFAQGFAVFIDWNQNNVFDLPGELVAFTPGVPPAAAFSALTFAIPANQPYGSYRMRVRCSFATAGNAIDPCANLTFGETEDYNITISPPGGGGGSSLTATISSNGPICVGQTLSLTLNASAPTPTVFWSGPGNFTSTAQNPVLPSATATMSGNYSISIGTSCPLVLNLSVTIVPYPTYVVIPQAITVCQNGSFPAAITIGFPQNYTYTWTTNSNKLAIVSPNGSSTMINTLPLPANQPVGIAFYSVVVTPTILNCPVTKEMTVTINNPPTPTLTMPPPLCNNMSATTVTANPPGGTWYGNPIVSPNGIVSPGIATAFGIFPVTYSIAIGQCTASNQGNISINLFRTSSIFGSIPNRCELDNPFNLMTIVQSTTGAWGGVGIQPNNQYFDPNNLLTGTYILTYFNTSFPNPNVCPMSSTASVYVFNPPTPVINPIAPKCTNSPTVLLTATPGGGTWSANAGVNMLGTMNPANVANTTGVNTVVYTAGQGTCVASSSATFHVSRFNTAALTSNGLDLCRNSLPVNLMSQVQSTVNGTWLGNNITQPGSFFNPATSTNPSETLTYTTNSTPNYIPNTGMANCTHSAALTINVYTPAQPTISPIGPLCNADVPLQLTVTPSTGSFVVTPYLTSNGIFNPSLTVPGNNPVQYVIGTNTCNASETRQISIEAFVPATIIGTLPDQCISSPVINLDPMALNSGGNWSGPGVLGTSFNPALAGTGNITIQYKTTSSPSNLCPDIQTLALTVYSITTPVISPEGPFCNSHVPITVKATPVGGVFVSSSSHAVSPNGVFNPGFAAIGNNVINYSVSAGPCIAFVSTVIKVEEFISADFTSYVLPLCKNSVPVELSAHVIRSGGTWSGPGLLGSVFTPSNANVGNNNIIVYRTHSETPYLCPDSSAMRITVIDVPDLTLISDIKAGCVPLEVNLNTPNVNSGEGNWVFGDGAEIKGLTATHTFSAPGTYSVLFNYWTPETRCPTQALLAEPIRVYDVPHPSFVFGPYQEVTISEPEVQFENTTRDLGNSTYEWQIANMYTLPDVNPKVVFDKTGEYRITLLATNAQGCKSEFSQIIVVEPDFRVFIPNSFSPNFDGINDEFFPVFSPFGVDKSTYEMEIFDRWGKSIFTTKDITKGWNGTVQNKGGDPLKQEVYVYRIKYRDLEGRIYTKMGNVSIVN